MKGWTVDYGEGEQPIEIPHAWRQDVPVDWEGPSIYRTTLDVETPDQWLVFDGVSYRAEVFVDDRLAVDHHGVWDAFAVPLGEPRKEVRVEVRVTKNGGPSFPVKDVLSGFLPYVFHTFGGIFRPVKLVKSLSDPTELPKPVVKPRVKVDGSQLFIDGEPFYMRGVLTWGWYPEYGHPNPPEDFIRRELEIIRDLGFNTVKFCLWLPSHEFLDLLEEYGLWAWVELPLWLPTNDISKLAPLDSEVRRIVRQYRHHDRVIAWTVGCELSDTPRSFREELVKFVQSETGCPLVKDNSGGAEMYADDLVEFGTFEDFHPYAETHEYPGVLASLEAGPRPRRPILLGEYNDYDNVRNLRRLAETMPYWASADPYLNGQGVRWQYDLPSLLDSKWADVADERYEVLRRFSISKGAYIRRKVTEAVRSRKDFSGYVITGWRDTPISTSGMVDDSLEPVYWPPHQKFWNVRDALYLIPDRRPPWIRGGNRPGWRDCQCFFTGHVHLRVGVHSDREIAATGNWRFEGGPSGAGDRLTVSALESRQVLEIDAELGPGKHLLSVDFGEASSTWPIHVFDRLSNADLADWQVRADLADLDLPSSDGALATIASLATHNLEGLNRNQPAVIFLERGDGLTPAPFWRECVFDYERPLAFANRWEWLLGLSTDLFMTPDWASSTFPNYEPLMTRIDTRTYTELVVMLRWHDWIVTTLRPGRQSADQPQQFSLNPAGHGLIRILMQDVRPDMTR